MKYKVGDKVKFRDDLVLNTYYGNIQFLPGMLNMRGRTTTIRELSTHSYHFRVCGSEYWYSVEMFEEETICEPVSLDISELL